MRLGWPRRCPLCEEAGETVTYLMIHCHYSKEIWSVIANLSAVKGHWEGADLEQALSPWSTGPKEEALALPMQVLWSIWIARNAPSSMRRSNIHWEYTTYLKQA